MSDMTVRDQQLPGRWGRLADPTIPATVALGLAVGGAVLGFERLVTTILSAVRDGPTWLVVIAPSLAIGVAGIVVRFGGAPHDCSTADEYLRCFHDRERDPSLRSVARRLVASVATLGLGAPLGLEGPSVLLGVGVARATRRWLRPSWYRRIDTEALLVAGAAAAVAAIFKAPATGAVFALEVPFRRDLARHQLMPALTGAATGYLAFAVGDGTRPLFPVAGSPPFDLRDLLGALILGAVSGALARIIALGIRRAKRWGGRDLRLTVAAMVVLAGASWATLEVTGAPIGIGPGYRLMEWATDPSIATGAIAIVLVIRFVSVLAATAGGGVGGFFIPLVVIGDLTGRVLGDLVGGPTRSLFPVLGIAAVLGAGYQVPLAAVMFVAETSGRPGYVVPALIAAVAADLTVGSESVTDYQIDRAR